MKKTTASVCEGVEKMEPSFIVAGIVKWFSHLVKTVCHFLGMLNIELPSDPEILLLGIYPREWRTYVPTKPYP